MQNIKLKLGLKVKVPPIESYLDEKIAHGTKNDCSFIIDGVYISDYQSSVDYDFLKKNKFTHIVNCAGSSKRFASQIYNDFSYLILDLKDDPGVDIATAAKQLIDFLDQADKATDSEKKVLIHCAEGVSRAPALVTSYLMWKYKMDPEAAIKLIKERRSCVEINLGFMCQLQYLKEALSKELCMNQILVGGI